MNYNNDSWHNKRGNNGTQDYKLAIIPLRGVYPRQVSSFAESYQG